MRLSDWLLPLLILVPPLLYYWRGSRLLAQGASRTRLVALAGTHSLAIFLPMIYVTASGLIDRLAAMTGNGGITLLVLFLPVWLAQIGHAYVGYRLDRRARMVDMTFWEYLKQMRIMVVIFLLAAPAALIQALPVDWPWAASHPVLYYVLTFVPGIAAGWAYLRSGRWQYAEPDPELSARLAGLADRLGTHFRQIRILQPKGRKVANAYITGARKGRQSLLLTDYLVASLTPAEIEGVVAHEVGHAHLRHAQKRLAWFLAVALCYVGLIAGLAWLVSQGSGWPDAASFALMVVVVALLWWGSSLLFQSQEMAADRWAAERAGAGAALAAALERLVELNQVNLDQLPRWQRTLATHPMNARRLAALRRRRR